MIKNGATTLPSKAWAVFAATLIVLTALVLHLSDGGTALAANAPNCNPTRPHASGAFDRTIDSGSLTREYVLHIPTSYDGTAAVPLLFNLHAFASNPPLQDVWSEWPLKGEEEGFIVVTPKGTPESGGVALHWNASQLPAPEPDDVAFLSELLTELESQLCVDASRVYSSGLSNGAFMSSQLACSIPDRIAAIGPVAGASFFNDCSSVPVPIIAFHGTDDPVVSFEPVAGTVIPAWATHNGCTSLTVQDPLPGTTGVRLESHGGCSDGASVDFYVVFDADQVTPGDQGGGHTWPGSGFVLSPGLEAIVGLQTQEISANDLMWDFFLAHPLDPKPVAPTPPSVGGISVDSDLDVLSLETRDSSEDDALILAAAAIAAGAFAVGGASLYATSRFNSWRKQR